MKRFFVLFAGLVFMLGLSFSAEAQYDMEESGDTSLLPVAVTPQAEEVKALPTAFGLSQNVPNPFNPLTEIRYQLPEASQVVLSVYDVRGRRVQVLVDDFVDAGYRTMVWDAKEIASGIYFVRMEAGDFIEVQKMVLIR